jgi:hypothetical protein
MHSEIASFSALVIVAGSVCQVEVAVTKDQELRYERPSDPATSSG